MCVLSELDWVKRWSHTQQTKGRSPVCVRTCVRKLPISENAFPHTEHTNGFSPRCMARSCRRRPQLNLNLTGHCEHANGWSELCTRWWRRRWLSIRNAEPHLSQRYRRMPACTARCADRSPGWRNWRPQSEQMYGVASECVRVWYCRPLACAKRLSHPSTWHTYGRSPVCILICTTNAAAMRNRRPQMLHMCLRSVTAFPSAVPSIVVLLPARLADLNFCRFRAHLRTPALRHEPLHEPFGRPRRRRSDFTSDATYTYKKQTAPAA